MLIYLRFQKIHFKRYIASTTKPLRGLLELNPKNVAFLMDVILQKKYQRYFPRHQLQISCTFYDCFFQVSK